MITEERHRNFYERQMQIRDSFDPFLNLAEVKRILGISYRELITLIQNGEIPASKVLGDALSKEEVTADTRGIRILPEDLEAYLSKIKIN